MHNSGGIYEFRSEKITTERFSILQARTHGVAAYCREALQPGIGNVNELADIVFYLHHPERRGRPLGSAEIALIN